VSEVPSEGAARSDKVSDTTYGKEWERKQLERGVDPRDPNVQEIDLNEVTRQFGDRSQWGDRDRYRWAFDQAPVVDAVGVNNGRIEYVASMAASNPDSASPKYYMDKFKKLMDFTESDKRGASQLRTALGFDGTDLQLLERMELHVPEAHVDMARQALEYRVRTVGGGYDFWRYQTYADHLKAQGFSDAAILENLKSKIVGR
jgi:hypothetical protein